MKRRWPPQFDEMDKKPTFRRVVIIGVAIIILVILAVLILPGKPKQVAPTATPPALSPSPTSTLTFTPVPSTATPSPTPTIGITEAVSREETQLFPDGLMILSLADGYYKHLFVYHPVDMQFTRLTNNPWDDVTPAISPDGTRLAYASRRNGFWDIYIFDLRTASATRVTDSLAYDGHPSWSPDGLWLAYESYAAGNLEIFIQSLTDMAAPPLQLTDDPWPDFEPSWSPSGDQIAFTSLRTGDADIWTVKVNQIDDRFTNISRNPDHTDCNPTWSPDGDFLAWSSNDDGNQVIKTIALQTSGAKPIKFASGSSPIYSPDGTRLLSILNLENSTALTGYNTLTGLLNIPAFPLPSTVFGWDWAAGEIGTLLPQYGSQEPTAPISLKSEDPANHAIDGSTGRTELILLADIVAAHPLMSDSVDDFFIALRKEISRTSGWDVLANLENAYLPITDPTLPGAIEDWLVTGLAYSINPLPLQAGWMAIQREDIGGEVYWRVYVKARYQDGSQGMPLFFQTWDLDARTSGDPQNYEEGGALNGVPEGYWIDLTELSNRFGWYRLPALTNWRAYFSAARFNQFAFTRGLDWETAMLELYPPELINQPTRIPSLTSTPTTTTAPLNSKTATAQVNNWLLEPTNPNPHPTWTPMPGETFP